MRLILAASSALLAACAAEPVAQPDEVLIDDLVPVAAEEVLRLGSTADPNVGFTSVSSIAVDRDDNIYVFESRDLEIRVYAPDGRLVREFGRRGEGPGEFRNGGRLGVQGDTVWVIEAITRYLSLFNRNGQHISTGRHDLIRIPWHNQNQSMELEPHFFGADGYFLSGVMSGGFRGGINSNRVLDSIVVPRLRFAATGALLDTVGRYTSREPTREYTRVSVGRSLYTVPAPPDREHVMLTRDGVITISAPEPLSDSQGEINIAWRDLNDKVTARKTLHYRPARYSAAELDRVAASAIRGGRAQTAPPGAEEYPRAHASDSAAANAQIRGMLRHSAYKQPLGFRHVGDDGSLWIQLVASGRWFVIDPHGKLLGAVQLPPRGLIRWSTVDEAIVVENDDMGVPWVVRYAVRMK